MLTRLITIYLINTLLTVKRLRQRAAWLMCIGLSVSNAMAATPDHTTQALSSSPTSIEDDTILAPLTPIDNGQFATTLPEYVVIQAGEQVTFSSETSASVASLSIREGSQFHKGSTLLTLDCRVQDADLKKAKAQQQVTNVGYVSAKKLKLYGSISEFEYLQAKAQKDMADAEVDKLTSIVEKCMIKAPFNGSVAKLMVHLYETVKPGDPLLKIVSTDDLDFVLQVPSTWLEWLHVGSTVNVHINELNKSIVVNVEKINPEIDSVSQTVKIIAKETNQDPELLPGMSGQATFPDKPAKFQNRNK